MKIIVTGGAGFIGSNLVERLVNEGHSITVVDNFHTGSESNLSNVMSKIQLVKSSAGDFFKSYTEKVDIIYHQGVYSSSPMYKENPLLTSEVVNDFVRLLEYARKYNIPKVVYASTSSIYNGYQPPHKEEMIPYITDFYTEARYAMDRIGMLYNKLYGIPIIGLRYFSVYGPHEKSKGKYANLITQFLWNLMENKSPVVYGDGTQTRDFTYVSDVVEANLLTMDKDVSGIFNVGTGNNISITDMVSLLNKKLEKNIPPSYIDNPIKNYVSTTKADTSKSERLLGFNAKVPLENGIEKIIKYYSS